MLVAAPLAAGDLPAGYWPVAKSQRILDKTLVLRLQPDLSGLTPAERRALDDLLEVGRISQEMYEDALHPQARSAHEELVELDEELGSPQSTQNLLLLYRLFAGPVATTLDNERVPFLPVEPVMPGKNVYPWGVERHELDAYLDEHPDKRSALLGLRTVVRRAEHETLERDLAVLEHYPSLEALHPHLRPALEDLDQHVGFYAVPYSVAWPDDTLDIVELLLEAAALLEEGDTDFAQFLRLRARDLMSDDYEAGDAAWVSGTSAS